MGGGGREGGETGCNENCCLMFVSLMIAYIALFSALLSRLTALTCGST